MLIKLYSDGFSFKKYDEESDSHFDEKHSFEDIVDYLWDDVELHETFTVRDLFKIFHYPDYTFWSIVLSEPFLLDLCKHVESLPKSDNACFFDYMQFQWCGEYYEKDNDLSIVLDVSGYKKLPDSQGNESGVYGLTLTPISDYLDSPLRIVEDFEIYTCHPKKNEIDNFQSFGKNPVRLIELLKAFAYEVTFLGSEEDKKEEGDVLTKRMNEYKKDMSDGKTFQSVEDLFKDILKES